MKIVAALYPDDTRRRLPGGAAGVLGLPEFLGDEHELVTRTETGEELDADLADADVFITTPFWPTYLDKDRLAKARSLKLVLTAGVGSDHVDLDAAAAQDIMVGEVTGSNVVSVAEHNVMQLLALVRNYIPAYQQVVDGRWDIAEAAADAHDLEGKTVGIVGFGQIGVRTALRLRAFDVDLYYNARHRRGASEEATTGAKYATLDDLTARCDAIILACPLTPQTKNLFDRDRLHAVKRGAWLVNTARGQIVETDALVEALESGQLAGYAGDVWYPQPAPPDHPWRTMPRHALTPHVSGTTLEAQDRYAAGVRSCVAAFLRGEPLPEDFHVAGPDQPRQN